MGGGIRWLVRLMQPSTSSLGYYSRRGDFCTRYVDEIFELVHKDERR